MGGEGGKHSIFAWSALGVDVRFGFDDYDDDMIIPTQCSIVSSRLALYVIEIAFEFKRGAGLKSSSVVWCFWYLAANCLSS
jgi:hypothetical protein